MGVGVGVGAGPGAGIAVGVAVGDGVGVGKVGVGLWIGSAGGVGTTSGEISSRDRIATNAITNITAHMLTHSKTRERVAGFLRALEDDVVDKSRSMELFYALLLESTHAIRSTNNQGVSVFRLDAVRHSM